MKAPPGSDRVPPVGEIVLACPDLAGMMGFCEDCYRGRVRVLWPYLTCYCQCNGVGVYAALTVKRENGREMLLPGPWKMKLEETCEEFEKKLPGRTDTERPNIKIGFP